MAPLDRQSVYLVLIMNGDQSIRFLSVRRVAIRDKVTVPLNCASVLWDNQLSEVMCTIIRTDIMEFVRWPETKLSTEFQIN